MRLKGLKSSMQNSKASGQNTPRLNFLIAGGGTLLPRIPYGEGFHRLVVRSDQIGLKNAHVYVNPFFTVSVKGNKKKQSLRSCALVLDGFSDTI